MLQVNELIGSGETRDCYRHPTEKHKCIKILKKHMTDDINLREYKYYSHLAKKHTPFTHIPKCYGYVDTQYGEGLVFDLIGENSGIVFEDYLKKEDTSKEQANKLFNELKEYLHKYAISFIDTGLRNLILVDDKLYIIDGLVPPKKQTLPIYGYIRSVTRWRTDKSLKEAEKRITRFFSK